MPAEALTERAGGARPGRRARPWRSPSGAPGSSTASSAAPTHTTQVVPGGTVTEKWVPVERVGLYAPGGRSVYPSSVIMNVVPAQEAGRRVDRASPPRRRRSSAGCRTRRSWPPARCSASTRCTRPAAPRPSRCSRTAPRTCPPGQHGHRPRQHLGRRRQAATSRAGSASTPRPGPTEIAVLADATADPVHVAADLISQAEHDPLAAAVLVTDSAELADAVEKELEPQVAGHQARRGPDRPGAGRPAVRDRPGRRHRRGPAGRRRVRRRAPGDPDRRRRRGRRPGAQRRRDLRRPLGAGLARRLLRRAPTTSCPPAAAPATPRACPSSPSCAASTSWTTPATRWPRSPHHVVTLAEAEDLPAHGAALKARFGWKVPESK